MISAMRIDERVRDIGLVESYRNWFVNNEDALRESRERYAKFANTELLVFRVNRVYHHELMVDWILRY